MFDKYQAEVCSTFKQHGPLDAHQARLLNWGLGLGGEAGEVQEVLKHYIYGGSKLDLMELAKELGDVLWYLTAIAETEGIHLEDIAALNAAKLQHRYASGEYSDKENQVRHESEAAFESTIPYRVIEARINRSKAPMNVIFIGPDGSGKTTLSKAVAAKMGFGYHKCDWRQDNKAELALSLLKTQTDMVYDRFYWPDEIIYSAVKKIEQSDEYWAAFNAVVDLLCQSNTLFIMVTASNDCLKERSAQWKDNYVVAEQIPLMQNAYHSWMHYVDNLHVSTMYIDTTGVQPDTAEFDMLVTGCVHAIEEGQRVYARVLSSEVTEEINTDEKE